VPDVSTDSDPISVTVPLPGVPVPRDLNAAAISSTAIEVAWTAPPAAADGSGYTYVLERTDTATGVVTRLPADTLDSLPSSPYFDQALSPGHTYSYTVQALDENGVPSAQSGSVSAATYGPPAQPTGLAATALSGTQVHLTWAAVAGASGYDVLRATSADGDFTSILPAGQVDTSAEYYDQSCEPGTTYYYQVKAVDGQSPPDYSAASDAASVTTSASIGLPIAPTNLQAGYAGQADNRQGPGRVGLTWEAARGVGSLGFDVYRGTSANLPLDASTLVGSSFDRFYIDDVPTPGATYYYAVKAVSLSNSGGEVSSPVSNVASVNTGIAPTSAPAAPDELAATSVTADHVTLTWRDNSLTETRFDIYRREAGTTDWGTPVGSVTADITTFTDTSVSPSASYEYAIAAHNEPPDSIRCSRRGPRRCCGATPKRLVWPKRVFGRLPSMKSPIIKFSNMTQPGRQSLARSSNENSNTRGMEPSTCSCS
jgi:titin